MADQLLPTGLAAYAAGVKPSTISVWASRGWVDPETGQRHILQAADRDWRGWPLYRYLDVMAAERATRRRGRQRDKAKWALLDINSGGMPQAC